MRTSLSDPAVESTTLVELLCQRALHQTDEHVFTFLLDGETEEVHLTYGELDRQARAIGAQLQALGLSGQRALLFYPPGLEYIAGFFGCLYAGVIAVPAYPPQSNRSIDRVLGIVADAQATVALTTSQMLSNTERWFIHAPELRTLRWIATNNIAANMAHEWRDIEPGANTLAFLQYTSGSTAVPKGVMLTHGNLLSNLALMHRYAEFTPDSRGVIWLPPYHDMGLIGGVLQPIYHSFHTVLMSPLAFVQRPLRWLRAMSHYKATGSGGPNFAYDLCARKITPEQRATLDLSNWELAFIGAEPVRLETLERFADTFAPCGFRREAFYPCYGLAEATLFVCGGSKTAPPIVRTVQAMAVEGAEVDLGATAIAGSEGGTRTLVSCGHILPGHKVVIADPESLIECPAGQVGEIWVAGPSVAQGYWNRQEESERTFCAYLADTGDGPFLRTGDLGLIEHGELFVTGRLKDLIIIDGRNHYPQDIELTVERSHEALQPGGCAAFSVNVHGEERLAIVAEVSRPYRAAGRGLALDVASVAGAIRRAVAEHHDVRVYSVSLLKPGGIPRTSSGKIQRHACRAGLLNETLDVWEKE
jgi:acyl-CoA synthetase (AMP-forming)/AMP-acid ligase II